MSETAFKEAITAAKNQYFRLDTLKQQRALASRPARKMAPTFGPQTPTMDKDWGLNLEYTLLFDTGNEHIPGGLLQATYSALTVATAPTPTISPITGPMCLAHLWHHAHNITNLYPHTDQLTQLLNDQAIYLDNQLTKREQHLGLTAPPIHKEKRQPAAILCAALQQQGHNITPQTLRKWVERKKITAENQGGTNYYLKSEIIRTLIEQKH